MGRFAALAVSSAIGFSIGFLGYLASPAVYEWLTGSVPGFLNLPPIGALVSGIIGSIASLMLVTPWSRRP